jgi:cell division transport system permease protein
MLYHIRQSWLAVRGNLTAAVATLTTMTLTLTILGLVALVTLNLERIVTTLEQDVQITAFLEPSQSKSEASDKAARVQQEIAKLPYLESAVFISKEEALTQLTLDYPYFGSATKIIDNPLSDRVVIKLKSPRDVKALAVKVEAIAGVQKPVEYGAGVVDNVLNALQAVRGFGYGLVALLLLNSLFNVLNTIRVAMYARRDEINVMRLIGATRGFIRAPYVLEGVGLGLLASLMTLIVLYPTYTVGAGRLQDIVPFLPLIREPVTVLQVIAIVTGLGVLLGLLGSLWATNRYLREVE